MKRKQFLILCCMCQGIFITNFNLTIELFFDYLLYRKTGKQLSAPVVTIRLGPKCHHFTQLVKDELNSNTGSCRGSVLSDGLGSQPASVLCRALNIFCSRRLRVSASLCVWRICAATPAVPSWYSGRDASVRLFVRLYVRHVRCFKA